MSGLVLYESSDEDDGLPPMQAGIGLNEARLYHVRKHKTQLSTEPKTANTSPAVQHTDLVERSDSLFYKDASMTEQPEKTTQSTLPETLGPVAGPTAPNSNGESQMNRSLPYFNHRRMIRDLTLPTVPNFDIPDSPSGSPPPGLDERLQQFIELKKQGIHFNEKLANSSALKNPCLLSKLMFAAGLEEQDQYMTTLPKHIWDPSVFPEWAYKSGLAKAQKLCEQEALQKRNQIDFVGSSDNGTGGSGLAKVSAAERVMAGLNKERTPARQQPRSRMR